MKKLRIITLLFLLTIISGCQYVNPTTALLATDSVVSFFEANKEKKENKKVVKIEHLDERTKATNRVEVLDKELENLTYDKTSMDSISVATKELKWIINRTDRLKSDAIFLSDYDNKTKLDIFDKKLTDKDQEVRNYRTKVANNHFKSFIVKNQSVASTLGFSKKYLDSRLMNVSITFEGVSIDNPTFREWLTYTMKKKGEKVSLRKISGFANPYSGVPISDVGLNIKKRGSRSKRFLFKEDMGELYASYYDSGDGNLAHINDYNKMMANWDLSW